jgi:glycosyltransferase involved in cell wall biosynthesis
VDALTAESVKLGHTCKVVVGDMDWGGQGCTHVEGVPRLTVAEGLDVLENEPWDAVHIHALWIPFIHKIVTLAKKKQVPIVWSVHGSLSPWAFRFKWWKKLPVWWLWQKRDLNKASVLHVTSEQEINWVSHFKLSPVIVNSPIGTALPEVKSCNDCTHRNKRLLFVGRLAPVKALPNLIKAWEMVRSFGWVLRIVGSGESDYVEMLKQLVSEAGLQESVEFPGAKFDADLVDEYQHADALALVSETENFGAVVTDAMAYGLPVITSKGTRWSEVVERKCGWWIENTPNAIADAIQALVALSDDERKAMGSRGQQLIQDKYTWPAVAQQMIAFYERLRKPQNSELKTTEHTEYTKGR